MRSIVFPLTSISLAAVVLAACGAEGPSANDLNMDSLGTEPTGSTTGPAMTQTTGPGPATTPGPTTPASTPTTTMTSGPNPPPTASTTSAPNMSGPDPDPTGPENTGPEIPGPEPTDTDEPMAPVPTGPMGGGGAPPVDPMPTTTEPVPGGGGMPPTEPTTTTPVDPPPPAGPYAPRTGPFNMLVYNRTLGFPHDSIPAGVAMLEQIAAENEITLTVTNSNELITAEGLANFEILFFMNPTGDIFNDTEQQAFEDWMTSETGGAFAGTHSATDTERGWAFYSDVTGQYYDGHTLTVEEGIIQWEPDALVHPTVVGLPNPWTRREEWYKFTSANWEGKDGFQILSRITNNDGGTRPVSYVREWSNFRSFYTSLGHESAAFQDADVKKHVTAGILWAVRREAQIP